MKMQQVKVMLLVCGLCLTLTGCGKLSDQRGQESTAAVTEDDLSVSPEAKDEELPLPGDKNAQESGEGYVYDYQVSMEPIAKEIADLGGPCQGTIHAFPSKSEWDLRRK